MFIRGHVLLICSLVLVKPIGGNKLVQHGQDLKQQGNILWPWINKFLIRGHNIEFFTKRVMCGAPSFLLHHKMKK